MATATVQQNKYKWGDIVPGNPPIKYYPVHDAQKKVIESNSRFTAAIAGTGGGKTAIGPLWLAKQIQRQQAENPNKPGIYMVVAPTYKVLSRATVPTLIEAFKGTALEGEYREGKSLYILPRKMGLIWCQGADSPGGLEGGQFDAIWGDEAGQFKKMVWTALQGRTGQKRAPILLTTTPYGKNWLFSDFFKYWEQGDPDYLVVQWSSIKNPAYPEEEYLRAKRTLTPQKAAMRYDGVFGRQEGLVCPNFADCIVDNIDVNAIIRGGLKFYGGIDYGWNDPFAALCGCLDSDDVLWIWYERYMPETTIEEHANALPKFITKFIRWYSDRNPEHQKKLKRAGHKVVNANKAIVPGIEAINARIYTNKLRVIKEACPALIAEMENWRYPEEDEVSVGDVPEPGDDHACDALRYLIMGVDGRRRIK